MQSTRLADLIAWFMERVDDPPNMHRRGIWVDPTDHAGSALGSPDWTAAWTRYLYAPVNATTVESFDDVCYHVGSTPGHPCQDCTVITEDGQVLYSTGMVKRHRLRYRWPMRLVLHRLTKTPARAGRPSMGELLWQLQLAHGDVHAATSALAIKHPVMSEPEFAVDYVHHALRRARTLYRQDVELTERPAGKKPKSDAQLDAEASG